MLKWEIWKTWYVIESCVYSLFFSQHYLLLCCEQNRGSVLFISFHIYTFLLKKKEFCFSLNSNIVSSEGLKEDFGQNREHPGDASMWSWWSHQLFGDTGGDAFVNDGLLPALDCLKSCTDPREFSHPGTCVILHPGLWAIHVHTCSVLWRIYH